MFVSAKPLFYKDLLREKYPNTKVFLVCAFPYSEKTNQKKLRIWTVLIVTGQ